MSGLPTITFVVLLSIFALLTLWPSFVLRVIVLLYPRRDGRRGELIAELYAMHRLDRPPWVAEQIQTATLEGIRERLKLMTLARHTSDITNSREWKKLERIYPRTITLTEKELATIAKYGGSSQIETLDGRKLNLVVVTEYGEKWHLYYDPLSRRRGLNRIFKRANRMDKGSVLRD